jgi:hypothetical protein
MPVLPLVSSGIVALDGDDSNEEDAEGGEGDGEGEYGGGGGTGGDNKGDEWAVWNGASGILVYGGGDGANGTDDSGEGELQDEEVCRRPCHLLMLSESGDEAQWRAPNWQLLEAGPEPTAAIKSSAFATDMMSLVDRPLFADVRYARGSRAVCVCVWIVYACMMFVCVTL